MSARILYFGSRSWIDVPPGWSLLAAQRAQREGYLMARMLADGPGFRIDPYAVDVAIDGPWPAAGQRRNARMAREGRPTHARGFVSGKRGAPLSRGSAGMLRILLAANIPTIVHREDGIEPMRLADLRARP